MVNFTRNKGWPNVKLIKNEVTVRYKFIKNIDILRFTVVRLINIYINAKINENIYIKRVYLIKIIELLFIKQTFIIDNKKWEPVISGLIGLCKHHNCPNEYFENFRRKFDKNYKREAQIKYISFILNDFFGKDLSEKIITFI